MPHPSGAVLHLLDEQGRRLLAVEGPLLIQAPGEVRRLLGTAAVTEPIWWVEARAARSRPDAAPIAYRFAEALAGRMDGVVWPAPSGLTDAALGREIAAPAEIDHPAADVVTDAAAVVLQERPIVPLSRWLADAAVAAAREAKLIQVVTPATSRLTTSLASILLAAGGRWVVETAAGSYYDGLRGEPLHWSGSAFQSTGGPAVAAEFAPPAEVSGGTIRLRLVALHAATAQTEFGAVVTDSFERLTGVPPAGWGVAEPASERWSRRELTDYCRRRAPEPAALVVVGGTAEAPAVGTLTVSHHPTGVVERLDLAVGCHEVPDYGRLDRLAEHLANLPAPTVQIMLVGLAPGRADCTVEPRFTGHPVPYGLLVGPEAVAVRGPEHARAAPAPHVLLCGPADRPSCWCRLPGGPPTPTEPAGNDPAQTLRLVNVHFGLSTDDG
jgi:hypothetical protein